MFKLSTRSLNNLKEVHPDLVRVMERAIAITPLDFVVIEGRRTRERQLQLVASGASRTMDSRHITGHAVDICPMINGEIRWDWPLYDKLAEFVKQAADDCVIPIEWGGDWPRFRDGPHWQLPREHYP